MVLVVVLAMAPALVLVSVLVSMSFASVRVCSQRDWRWWCRSKRRPRT